MRGFPQQWKLKEKRRPKSHLTLDVDFARVLLNDAVSDGEAEAGAAGLAVAARGLGGEERIVDAAQVLGSDAGAAVGNGDADVAVDLSGDAQGPAFAGFRGGSGHGVFSVQEEIEEDLLQLAGIAHDARKVGHETGFDGDLRGLELMLEQGESVADDGVDVGLAILSAAGAREIEEAVDDLGGAEGLLSNLVEQGPELLIAFDLTGQHLCIG